MFAKSKYPFNICTNYKRRDGRYPNTNTMLPDRLTESNSIEISKKEARAIVDALQFLFISQKFDDETGHYATTGEVTGMMHPVTRDFLRMITYKLNQA